MSAAIAARINAEMHDLEISLERAIADLIADLTFQDIPIHKVHGPHGLGLLHFVEVSHEHNDERHVSPHHATTCNGACDLEHPAVRIKWGRKGRGTWRTFLGTFQEIASYGRSYDDITGEYSAIHLYIPADAFDRRCSATGL